MGSASRVQEVLAASVAGLFALLVGIHIYRRAYDPEFSLTGAYGIWYLGTSLIVHALSPKEVRSLVNSLVGGMLLVCLASIGLVVSQWLRSVLGF